MIKELVAALTLSAFFCATGADLFAAAESGRDASAKKSAKASAASSKKKSPAVRVSKTGKDTVSLAPGTPIFELPPSAPSKNQPYALNVVYFVPADMEPFPDYERRLSEIMLSLQRFYGEQMTLRGYEGRTFGLNKSADGKRVNIVVIKGKKNKEAYPYQGGAGPALNEINAFFDSEKCPVGECASKKKCRHRKLSDHTLIIMPSTSGNEKDPGGVPFYGMGKNCFALDYPLFDLKYSGEDSDLGRLFSKWYGGMGHELGHGLNLWHNSGRKSEDATLGTALLGYGNYTLGREPTFLTEASCATLDCSQTFRTTKMPKTPAPVVDSLVETAIRFGEGGCRVSGKLPAKNRVEHVLVYYDKDAYEQVNDDYDAESFVADFDREKNTFTCEIPIDEIHPGNTPAVEIRIHLINDDGSRKLLRYPFPTEKKDVLIPANTSLAALEPPAPVPDSVKKKKERERERAAKKRK